MSRLLDYPFQLFIAIFLATVMGVVPFLEGLASPNDALPGKPIAMTFGAAAFIAGIFWIRYCVLALRERKRQRETD